MARTIWTGSLSFGLVNVPVGLYTATRDRSIHFNQFEEGTSDRIRYKKINERTGEEVDNARIVKGVDIGGGDYVILSDDELEAAAPERSRAIEITDFVDLDAIDPIYYRTTYYLAPQGDGAGKAYALLRKAMRASNKVGIATIVMRGKEYLVAVRPEDDVLALETMYFADEVRSPTDELPVAGSEAGDAGLSDRELTTAQLLIDSMASEWEPDQYHDTYRQRVEELIDQKRRGEEIVTEAEPPRQSNVVDLMEALQASVSAVRVERGGPRATTRRDPRRRRRPRRSLGPAGPVRRRHPQRLPLRRRPPNGVPPRRPPEPSPLVNARLRSAASRGPDVRSGGPPGAHALGRAKNAMAMKCRAAPATVQEWNTSW